MKCKFTEFGYAVLLNYWQAATHAFNRMGTRWSILLVFASSLAVSLLFRAMVPTDLSGNEATDYAGYSAVASQILDQTPIDLSTTRGIGYSLLIAAVMTLSAQTGIPVESGMTLLSLMGMGGISILVFLLARLVWSTSQALVPAILWLTYPFGLWLTKQPNSEIPFMVFLYAGLLLVGKSLHRRGSNLLYLTCSGLMIGLAMLIRPSAIGIGLLLATCFFFLNQERSIRLRLTMVTILLAGNLIVVTPWEAWVFATTGRLIPISSNGVTSVRDGLTFGVATKNYREGHLPLPEGVLSLMQRALNERDHLQSASDVAKFIGNEIRIQPVAVMELALIKATRSWYATDSQRFELLIGLTQLVYLASALIGVCLTWRKMITARGILLMLGLVVFYFWGITILVLPILRYMVPAMGLLFVATPGILSSGMLKVENSA